MSTVTALMQNQRTAAPELNRVIRVPLFRRSLAEFNRLTGLAAKLVPAVLPGTPINFGTHETVFCRRLAACLPCGCPFRLEMQSALNRRLVVKLKPHQTCCPLGILQVAVPVVVSGRHVATIVGGKVRLASAGLQPRAGLDRQLRRCGLTGDLRSLQRAYRAIPIMAGAKLQAALRLLDQLARLFAAALVQEPMPASLTQPPMAFQTSQFIRQHLGERLTTRQTAAAFHLSEAYFCRRFHQLTGMTFHAYVTQLRVERAKAALRTTDARVNEIALALGFQSASHFNRAFKLIAGMTPSAFRGQRRQRRQRR